MHLKYIFPRVKVNKILCRYISTDRDYYQILEIESNATHAQIKTAFYKLSLVYHPDKNTAVDAAITFHDISEAYEILGNYKTRKQYDRGLIHPKSYEAEPKQGTNYQPTNYKFYRNWAKQEMQPKGKTVIYDFDEFYRAHYGDKLKRKERPKTDDDEIKNLNGVESFSTIMGGLGCVCMLSLIVHHYL